MSGWTFNRPDHTPQIKETILLIPPAVKVSTV